MSLRSQWAWSWFCSGPSLLTRGAGHEVQRYRGNIGITENQMETTIYWGCIGIMEKKMETTIMENQMEKNMENEMETGIIG